ncbi:MAG: VWA domain-containing protein [Phycisphaerales bacterium]|nr:VWA domain-containing protein [Phycisphaerales bacterium]
MELEFANLTALHWLWAIAALTVLAVWGISRRRGDMRRFADSILLAKIAPSFSTARPVLRAALLLGALTAIVFGLSDPRWGIEQVETKRRGADVIFVLDVSRSMLAQDATPDRLERAKQFASDAVDRMGGDRVGLLDFAGVPAIRVPLTLNYGAMRSALAELTPKQSLRGGSMLGDAIRVASESFVGEANVGRAIVVLSDGEDMGSFPVEAAQQAFEEHGIRVFTVGIGDTAEGGRIPLESSAGRTYLTHDGQEVWTKMDPDTLRATAEAGGGVFIPAGTAQIDLGEIIELSLAELERQEFEVSSVHRSIPRFQWPVALALLLLLAECAVRDRSTQQMVGGVA